MSTASRRPRFDRFAPLLAWGIVLAFALMMAGNHDAASRLPRAPAPIAAFAAEDFTFDASADGCLTDIGDRFALASCTALAGVASAAPSDCPSSAGVPIESPEPWAERIKGRRAGLAAAVGDGGWLRTMAAAPLPEHAGPSRPPLLRPPRG